MAKKEQVKAEKEVDELINDENVELTESVPPTEGKEINEDDTKLDNEDTTTNEPTENAEQAEEAEIPQEEPAVPPPKPKRPLTPKQEAFKNLKDAFPTIEDKYVTGVLIASNYNLESSFNALLYISDPENVNPEDLIPANQQVTVEHEQLHHPEPTKRELTQLEQDELLARQLNDEYSRRDRRRERQRQDTQRRRTNQGDGNLINDDEDDDAFTNFVEKDLPQIKEQFTKNIEETKTKFSNWVSGWKQQYQQSANTLNKKAEPRFNQRNTNLEFDDDPEEVDFQKFHGISLNDSTGGKDSSGFQDLDAKPNLPNRTRSGSTDLYGTPKSTNTGKKWESLKGIKPEPSKPTTSTVTADDDDDFLLTDDEKK